MVNTKAVQDPQTAPALHCFALHLAVQTAKDVVAKVIQELGRIDVLVNNASVQHYCDDVTNITPEQLSEVFTTNVFGYFYFAQVGRLTLVVWRWWLLHVWCLAVPNGCHSPCIYWLYDDISPVPQLPGAIPLSQQQVPSWRAQGCQHRVGCPCAHM